MNDRSRHAVLARALGSAAAALLLAGSPAGARAESAPEGPTGNFYAWANRDWLAKAEIAADQARVDNFTALESRVYERLEALLAALRKAPSRTADEEKLVRLYESFSDLAAREKAGLLPLAEDLRAIDAVRTHQEVARRFAELQAIGVPSPLMIGPLPDFKDSTTNLAVVIQSGLGMTRDDYSGTDARAVRQRVLYEVLLIDLFRAAALPDAAARARDALAVETQLAAIQWSNVDNRDMQKIYNPRTRAEFVELTRDLYGEQALSVLGIPSVTRLCVAEPSYVEAYATLFRKVPVEAWKSYMTARLLAAFAPVLSSKFHEAAVRYDLGRGLYAEEKPGAKQAIDYLNVSVPMMVGRAYVARHFDEKTRSSVEKLVFSIRDEFRASIARAAWLTPATKAKALEKIDAMEFKIGYPARWKDFSALAVEAGDAAGNQRRLARFAHERDMEKIGRPVDRTEWDRAPQEINAFYDSTKNSFVLLAGILQEPFFSATGSPAANYGGIGFVIGHEIGHGFDDQGSRFGPGGNLVSWWTEADDAAYARKRKALIEQANAYEILPGTFLKGELEIGEIMGDLSGAQVALNAYRKAVSARGRVDDAALRSFFEQLASTWRSKWRPAFLLQVLATDGHPPSEFRANGIVKQFREFHDLYGVKPGDGMYLAPERRVLMW